MFLRKESNGFYHIWFNQAKDNKKTRVNTECEEVEKAENWVTLNLNNLDLKPKDIKKWESKTERKQNNTRIVEPESKILLKDFKEKILEYNNNYVSKDVNRVYHRILTQFENYIGQDTFVEDITTFQLEGFKASFRDLKPSSINIKIQYLKRIFNLGVKWKIIKENPTEDLKYFRIPEKEIGIFSKEQFDKLLNVIENDKICQNNLKIKNMALFSYYTGCRISEILNLQWLNINWEERYIKIVNKENFKTKTGRHRNIPISDKLFEILKSMKNGDSEDCYIFSLNNQYLVYKMENGRKLWYSYRVNEEWTTYKDKKEKGLEMFKYVAKWTDNYNEAKWFEDKSYPEQLAEKYNAQIEVRKKRFNREYISGMFTKYCKVAGLTELSFHKLRHTFCSNLSKNNVSVFKIKKLAGHSQISTTLKYTHFQLNDLREEVNLI